ncbi:hypothetical protein ACTTAM_15050 [Rhodobacter capsulatus]|uniref:hypothetical protein n=1 Tax=Rhodobacter capsulatus TaxID=1061 RepID=UPI004028465A
MIRARVIKLRRAEPLAAAAPVPAPETAPATTPEAASVADPAAEDIDRMLASVSATMAEAAAPESPAAPEPAALSPEAEAELMAELAALTENLGDVDWGIEGWSTESAEAEVASAPVAPEAVPEPAPEPQLAAEAAPEPEVEIEALVVELDPEPEEEAAAASAVPEAPAAKKPEIDIDALFAEDTPAPAAFTVVTLPPDAPPPGVAERRTHPAEPLILPARPAAKVPPLPEGDLPRLLEKADAQMAGNENRRRISAIAHLKAAVAATVAERRAGTEEAQKDETAPYRQDLTQAVRPRRPVLPAVGESHHQTAARPEARPAPLVLVSEQRVDRAPRRGRRQGAGGPSAPDHRRQPDAGARPRGHRRRDRAAAEPRGSLELCRIRAKPGAAGSGRAAGSRRRLYRAGRGAAAFLAAADHEQGLGRGRRQLQPRRPAADVRNLVASGEDRQGEARPIRDHRGEPVLSGPRLKPDDAMRKRRGSPLRFHFCSGGCASGSGLPTPMKTGFIGAIQRKPSPT